MYNCSPHKTIRQICNKLCKDESLYNPQLLQTVLKSKLSPPNIWEILCINSATTDLADISWEQTLPPPSFLGRCMQCSSLGCANRGRPISQQGRGLKQWSITRSTRSDMLCLVVYSEQHVETSSYYNDSSARGYTATITGPKGPIKDAS